MSDVGRVGALLIVVTLGLVVPATVVAARPPAAMARQLADPPAGGGGAVPPPLSTPASLTSVCAYLAVTDFTRAIDPGFAAHALPPGTPTPSPARASPAASAYCHPLPPLAPVGRP